MNPYAWLGDMIDKTIKDQKAEIASLKADNEQLKSNYNRCSLLLSEACDEKEKLKAALVSIKTEMLKISSELEVYVIGIRKEALK